MTTVTGVCMHQNIIMHKKVLVEDLMLGLALILEELSATNRSKGHYGWVWGTSKKIYEHFEIGALQIYLEQARFYSGRFMEHPAANRMF